MFRTILTSLGLVTLISITVAAESDCSDTTETSDSPPMAAHIQVQPGGVTVINNNDFPWYGLIYTINDNYSTRFRFGHSNYPFLRPDSIVEPDELETMLLDNFTDKHGSEFETVLHTITIKKVELEAKSQIDGPYDLKFKIRTVDANATPIPERRPTISTYLAGSEHSLATYEWTDIDHHEPEYEKVLNLVTGHPQNEFGRYILPPDVYTELQRVLGRLPSLEETTKTVRWQEQWAHWKNIDAFQASVLSISEDLIIDKDESQHICFTLEQRLSQMENARNYVQEFRKVDPKTVEDNPGLSNLQHEAERALELLKQIECE